MPGWAGVVAVVTEFFLGLVTWLGQFVIGMLPEDESSEIVGSASGVVANVVGMANGVSVWIPWSVIGVCFVAVSTFYIATFTLKIIRQLLAHVPLVGGTG